MFRRLRGKDRTSNSSFQQEEKKTEDGNAVRRSSSVTSSRSCVYQEAMEMLTGALIIYIFAELREMARENGKLQELEPPLTSAKVLRCIQENATTLEERAIDHDELAKRLTALHQVEESSQEDSFLSSLLDRVTSSS